MSTTILATQEASTVTHTMASPTIPTLATEGLDLSDCQGFRVILSAESSRTLSLSTGTPTLDFYLYDPTLARWAASPRLQIALTSTDGGGRDVAFEDQACFVPWGRVYVVPNGITASGGTTCTVQLVAYRGR